MTTETQAPRPDAAKKRTRARRGAKGGGYLLLRRRGKWYGDRAARNMKGGVWYACFDFHGRKHYESGGGSRSAADDLLRDRLKEIKDGVYAPGASRVTLAHLREIVVADYLRNGRRSLDRMWNERKDGGAGGLFANLTRIIGERATADRIPYALDRYVAARLEEGAANATVNRELAALRRAFRLAVRAKRLLVVPHFPEPLAEPEPRSGHVDRATLDAILAKLADYLRDPILFEFLTGTRVRKALDLEWRNVDERAEVIRLGHTGSATKHAGTIPYGRHPELRAMIERRRAETDAWQRERGQVVPWVFWQVRVRGGRLAKGGEEYAAPITDYRRRWDEARRAAGHPGVLVHDLRRSFAVEGKRLGVEDGVLMKIAGWKTRSVFDRYRIVDESDVAAGMARLGGETDPGASLDEQESAQDAKA